MEEVDYSFPVHTSLMEKSVMFGIGSMTFSVIAMVTTLLATMISGLCILLGVIAIIVCRMICKNDKMTLEFVFQNLGVRDFYRG